MQKLISIIIPAYNEEKNVVLIYQAVAAELQKISDYFNYEILFINDGSTDNSLKNIEGLMEKDYRVKLIDFSRNFGKELATTAGLNNTSGDLAIIIDADLQHPPELISEFVAKWKNGAEMVVGVRKRTRGVSLFKRISSIIFYNLINLMGITEIKARATDYRLVDRKIINEFNRFTERNRITRGLLDWLGFKKEYVYFEANERINGKAVYNRLKLFKLALAAIVAHSLFPLKLAGYLGIIIILFSGPLGLFIFVDRYIFNDLTGFNFSGPAMLALLNLFLTGIILGCLGLTALYIGSIQNEAMNRPLYVIRQKKNFVSRGK